MNVIILGAEISDKEKEAYIERANTLYPDKIIDKIVITIVDETTADIEYYFHSPAFQRIRRITGYLVGTLDRFNDAKRAEVGERLTHQTDFEEVFE